MKKEIPVLFSTKMVQAILAGRKTQTRRIVKPQPLFEAFKIDYPGRDVFKGSKWIKAEDYQYNDGALQCPLVQPFKCPYGKPGDLLWVRESFAVIGTDIVRGGEGEILEETPQIAFRGQKQPHIENLYKWKPSIHMPKSAARIWLEVTKVRVERLQDIDPHDAGDEGVNYWNVDWDAFEGGELVADYENYMWRDDPEYEDYHFPTYANPVDSFRSLWQSINGEESWNANPWVWAIGFKVLSTTGKPHSDLNDKRSIATEADQGTKS